jgi:hypothetical protein
VPEDSGTTVEVLERGSYVESRYLGTYSLDRYKTQMELSTRACLDRKVNLLLVDITDLAGFRPTTFERHAIGIHGASVSRSLSKVAVLGTREQIGDGFSTTVARNRGLAIRAFLDRDEALRWLLNPSGGAKP